MKITMIGAGYVGLVSGVCFSDCGFDVICSDIDEDKIAALNAGKIPIYEPGLDELLQRNIEADRLKFSNDVEGAVRGADAVFLAVGTPSRPGGGEADLSFLFAGVKAIAPFLKEGVVVVTKSTVVVSTNERIRELIVNERPELDFSVVSNPEFLREGSAIKDFMKPDRIVVGVHDERGAELMKALYAPLQIPTERFIVTSLANAELIKYASNAFLAMKVTFINEVANLCEMADGDVTEVAHAIGLDERIGGKFLSAGPGIGGSCFPKDTRAFAATGVKFRAPQRLIETVIQVNEARKIHMADRILAAVAKPVNKTAAILGIAFKPETDDVREAPSLTIIPRLIENGMKVRAYDPEAMVNGQSAISEVTWCESAVDAAAGADILVVLTEWDQFRNLDLKTIAGVMSGRLVFDTRNIFDQGSIEDVGLQLMSVGSSNQLSRNSARKGRL